jgi:mRNA interferase MazF
VRAVSRATYTPDRGDVVWLDFTPQAGREQAGRRPALVLSPASYNSKTSLMVCCPVTSQIKGYPFEVPVAGPATTGVTGVALADHVRSLDWKARNAVKLGVVDAQVTLEVGAKLRILLP